MSVTLIALFALGSAGIVRAHSGADGVLDLATAWSLSPWLLVPLTVFVVGYVVGLARLWHRAGAGHGISFAQAGLFAAGLMMLALSLIWPLDAYGEWSLAAHMAQHMLLLALAPPLLLLGQPLAALAQALPAGWSRWGFRRLGAPAHWLVDHLALATVAHCAVMWLWHLPAATAAALASDPVHWLMHGSFLLAGLWFWAAALRQVREPTTGAGPALVAMVAVMMQMGLLGALLSFARRPLYPVYAERAPQLGLDVLVDQQLAGLIMWVPTCVPYLVGGIWLLARSLRWLDRQSPTGRGEPVDGPGERPA